MKSRQDVLTAAVRALRERGGGRLPPDIEQLVRYYVSAEVEVERAGRHLFDMMRGHGPV